MSSSLAPGSAVLAATGEHIAPVSANAFVELRSIRKHFGGVEVLHGVDLEVDGGTVLALLGENGAGKSTLMRILAGDLEPDEGTIRIGADAFARLDAPLARSLGIRMIFQELSVAPALSAAENVFLGRWPAIGGRVRWSEMNDRAAAIFRDLEVDLDPRTAVADLEFGHRQIVEIARAISDRGRILVLDEPTAALSDHEAQRLFEIVARVQAQGVAVIYITHRLDEVRLVADRVQVLRDGASVLHAGVDDVTREDIVGAMVGRSIGEIERPPTAAKVGDAVLTLQDATADGFTDVTLTLHRGEVLVLYGKLGSGTAPVAEVLFGLRPLIHGAYTVSDGTPGPASPATAIDGGYGFVPADRQRDGGFGVRSVAENVAAPSWGRMSRWLGFLGTGIERAAFIRWRGELAIASLGGPRQEFRTLSGGNQQKTLLARWFERDSDVLIMVEPTRGVDVGARADLYASLRERAATGRAVLLATSDYEEAIQVADRVVVMARGSVVAAYDGADITGPALLSAAGG